MKRSVKKVLKVRKGLVDSDFIRTFATEISNSTDDNTLTQFTLWQEDRQD